jgi:hypothetical protein
MKTHTLALVIALSCSSIGLADETKNPSATATGKSGGTKIVQGKPDMDYALVKVQIRGEDAQKVYALGEITAEPIEVGGRKIGAEPPMYQIKGFSCLHRWSSTSPHPKDGIEIVLEFPEVQFPEVPQNEKLIGTVRGTVQVLVGGSEYVVSIGDLLNRKSGPIESPVLKKAKLEIDFERWAPRFDDKANVTIKMDKDERNGFAGLQLVGADGMVRAESPAIVQIGNSYDCSYRIDKADLGKASLRILVRDGGEVKSLPFEVHNVKIK